MNEELKQEQNLSKNNSSKTEQNNSNDKYKAAEYILAGLAIGFILAITGLFLWNNFQKNGSFIRSERSDEQNIVSEENILAGKQEEASNNSELNEAEKKDESSCGEWQKYVHPKADYSICIPQGWTVKEADYMSQVVKKNVKYIEIFSSDKQFKLYLGFRKNTDDFEVGDRTGIGAGEDKKIDEITVLGKKMSVDGHYFMDEIREVFFGVSEPKWKGDLYEIYAYFDKTSDTYDPGKGIKIDEPALEDAKKILESIGIVKKSGGDLSECPSNLTSSEKDVMENWKTYTDEKNKFSFMYPKDQTISKIDEDVVNVNNKDGSTSFSVRSNVMAAADFYGYDIINESPVQVDCLKATRLVLATDIKQFPKAEKRKIISTQIDREKTRQRLEMNYPNLNSASLESDYFETYDMVMKSIKFIK